MKLTTGAILLLAAVQAYAHANSIPFPNQQHASEILIPASLVLTALGIVFLVWGTVMTARDNLPERNQKTQSPSQ